MSNSVSDLFQQLSDVDVFSDGFSETFSEKHKSFFKYDRKCLEQVKEVDFENEDFVPTEGRYSIKYKGLRFETLLKRGTDSVLIVTFDGARTAAGGKMREIPHFPRWSWYPFIDGNFLCFEDPMYYEYPDLKLGWFYGTEKEDYTIYLADIIRETAKKLNIAQENIIMYGSSGGGTTGIRLASILEGTKAVAINPQLDISKWDYPGFERITGIDLKKDDIYHRNDLPFLIKNAPASRFLILVNSESRIDVDTQLTPFCSQMNWEKKPHYGLNRYENDENVLLWLYDAPGKNPHVEFEDYCIYFYLRKLLEDFDKNSITSRHSDEVFLLSEFWRNTAIKKNQLNTSLAGNIIFRETDSGSAENMAACSYRAVLDISKAPTQFCFRILCDSLIPQTLYRLCIHKVSNLSRNIDKITIGLFDFSENYFVKVINYKIEQKNSIGVYFSTGDRVENTKLIIYAGEAGSTKGNSARFEGIELIALGKNQ